MNSNEVNTYDKIDRPFLPHELDDVNHNVNRIIRPRMRRRRKIINPKATKICTSTCRFNIIRTTARKFGMIDVAEYQDWQVFWTDVFPSLERCRCMKRYQKINHFPGMLEICRKDSLAKNLHQMLKHFPKDYNFFPRTWCLPEDYIDMVNYAKNNPGKTYILKPCRGSEGRGIILTKNPKHLKTKYNMVSQIYINKPLLIDGFKFDFRLYVLVTSCDPLRIYVYNEGLARFATKKYAPSNLNLNMRYMHLTNYAVNRRSEDFIIDDDQGSKRKLSSINEWFVKQGYDINEIWASIDDIIIKTLLIVLPKLKHYYRLCFPKHVDVPACFELLGFDFILDNHLKPYLLEINYTPSFNRNTPVDRKVKDALLTDVFKLINLNYNDQIRIEDNEKQSNKSTIWNHRRELAKQKMRYEQHLKERVKWEESHLGDFRKIYPTRDNLRRYKPFLKLKKNQIFPKTMAPLICEEDYDLERGADKIKMRDVRLNPFLKPNIVLDEKGKLDEKFKREFLLQSHNLLQNMYNNLNQSGQKQLEKDIMLTRTNCWDLKKMHIHEYEKQKENLTTGISAVLKTISSKSEIPQYFKEKLSSIFLNPPSLINGDKQSHIGPIGPEAEITTVRPELESSDNEISDIEVVPF